MEQKAKISHPGEISEVYRDKVVVRILSLSACASCHAKGACTMADLKEKFIEVDLFGNERYEVGQKVVVEMEKSMGPKAVLFAFVLPIILLVAALIVSLTWFSSQGLAALFSLALVAIYFFVIRSADSRLKRNFVFTIRAA
ncbi:MAG: SoxR reducing system RseC family protein [Bacteroidales bacterium]